MARERAHERALLALGSQRGVDLPQGGLAGRARAHAREARREARPHGRGVRLVEALRGLDDVDHVDVGDVVELARPALAHADDREAHPGAVVVELRARDGERALESAAAARSASAAPTAGMRVSGSVTVRSVAAMRRIRSR